MLEKRLLVIVCILMGLIWCIPSYATDKVGYVNLQRLINESKMGKAAREDIQKLRKQKEAALASKLKEINTLRDEMNEKENQMDPREKRDKRAVLKRAYEDYQRLVNDAKEDILKEDREIVSIILKKADGVLKKVAKKKKFAIILKDPNAIGYLDPSVDITDDVLKVLNQKK
jgi:outer membrane protein